MSDGWKDRRGRYLINFLANSPDATFVMGSVDALSESHNHLMLANLLQSKIEEIGKEYVIQIARDNGANYKKACQLLITERFPILFWTPCAAHCMDLMLEDIGSYKVFDTTIKNAKRIKTFIYRHGCLHNAMTVRTGGRELVRPGATRFATSFLTLQSLCKFQAPLRQLFIDDDRSRAAQPLLVSLRVVDADEKAAMPDIIEAMELAKKTTRDSFENNASLCKYVINIIYKRWDTQIEVQWYAAGLFLNPGKFFDIQEKDYRNACKLREDFNDVLEIQRVTKLIIMSILEKILQDKWQLIKEKRRVLRRELGEKFDLIALEDFNWSGEWVGNPDGDVVHPGEDLLWENVAIAAGPASAVRNLRNSNRDQGGETNTSAIVIKVGKPIPARDQRKF
ncbi:hypothetical protein AgCh_021802 [Apium graveolens]